ncbi:MAG: hypothetical protein IJR74_05940, partial [Paludibacteraceae bacterium]|nr:hypothetical protein [Paludibacteraceae bacterium]
ANISALFFAFYSLSVHFTRILSAVPLSLPISPYRFLLAVHSSALLRRAPCYVRLRRSSAPFVYCPV